MSDHALYAIKSSGAQHRRELERLVCEVGFDYRTTPREQRPEPDNFSDAIKAALKDGEVAERIFVHRKTPYRFWTWANINRGTTDAIYERKTAAFAVFNAVEHVPKFSGWHAEMIHHQSLLDAHPTWLSVGWASGQAIKSLGARTIDKNQPGDVDLAGFHRLSGIPFASQVKNGREWVYPPNAEIWNLLGAAAQLEAIPLFIARRLPERTFFLMSLIGGFAFRATKMIFPPNLIDHHPIAGSMSFSEALKELSFHADVDFIDAPLPRHQALWTGALSREAPKIHERFLSVAPRILEIAYGEKLARERDNGAISKRPRRDIVDEFLAEIQARDRQTLEAIRDEALASDEAEDS